MAKVGEGDPRWIVDDRKDGTNVNAWHWEERDLSTYVHDKLKKVLCSLKFAENRDGVVYAQIDEVSEITGDVTVAQRKGKMMCYFELKMTLEWSGVAANGDENVFKGKLIIPEVDHDELMREFNIDISCQEKSKAAHAVENAVRSEGRMRVREEIRKFFESLFQEYHIGKVVKGNTVMPPPPSNPSELKDVAKQGGNLTGAPAERSDTCHSKTHTTTEGTSFEWKMRWRIPIEQLFQFLVDEKTAGLYTRSSAKINAKADGQFEFLGGVISGYYVELQAPTLIKQRWRLKSWPVGVHSSVVMRLIKEEPGVTVLDFAQAGIPAGELQNVKEGWKVNFFDAMRMFFGISMEYI